MRLFTILFMAMCLLACSQAPSGTPAPLGDYATLEKLADAYRKVGQSYPVQPHSMRPAGRKQFLQQVFAEAGYDYSATLTAVAAAGVDASNQDHRDLVELLLLPHQGMAEADWDELYTRAELAAVQDIRAAMH
jgi:hypothetical protein